MANPFIGEIRMFGGTFAPRGWAFCSGQTLAIAKNEALYSLLGTTYGGNGIETFRLPDLQGRIPIHQGWGPGRAPRQLGESGGTEVVALTANQMPAHLHPLLATDDPAGRGDPSAALFAQSTIGRYRSPGSYVSMATDTISNVGGGEPHTNVQPFACVSFIICLEGIYPSRS